MERSHKLQAAMQRSRPRVYSECPR